MTQTGIRNQEKTEVKQSTQNEFNDHRRARATVYFLCLVLVVMSLISLYAIVTLNLKMLFILVLIMILQKRFCHRNQTFINFIVKICKNHKYFNKFEHIYEEEPTQDTRIIYCHHPHSILPYACTTNMNYVQNKPISKMTVLGSRFMLNIPVVGMLMRLWGMQSVNAKNMERIMKKNKSIGLVPGGYEEATITSHKVFRLYLKDRKGFVKLALKYGYSLVPIVVMNEHKMFKTTDFGLQTRIWLNKYKIPSALSLGKFIFFADYDLDIYNIIGKPIKLPEIKKPSNEDVDKWHKIYMQQVIRLYKKYEHLNGNCALELF